MNTPKTDAQQGGETPTPRTDEAMRATQGLFRAAAHSNGFVHFARQLERENAYLQSQLDRANEDVLRGIKRDADSLVENTARAGVISELHGALQACVRDAEAWRDKKVAQMGRLDSADGLAYSEHHEVKMPAWYEIACTALQSAQP